MDYMAPQWIAFPAYTEFTIGWRMGAGEGYKWEFWNWYETLSPEQQREYQTLFPYPCFWHYNKWEENEQDIVPKNLSNEVVDDETLKELIRRKDVLYTPHSAFFTDVSIKNSIEASLNSAVKMLKTGKSKNQIII